MNSFRYAFVYVISVSFLSISILVSFICNQLLNVYGENCIFFNNIYKI